MKYIRVGQSVRVINGSIIGCDFHEVQWHDDGEVFTVKEKNTSGRYELIADGYGNLEGKYGNGTIFVRREDLLPVSTINS